jgi:predicted GIY-YIG superfamily endonuclease
MQTLYRMRGEEGELLYIGITAVSTDRFSDHRHNQPWWHLVRQIEVEHFETRAEVMEAELKAIRSENPKFNRAGRPLQPEAPIIEPDAYAPNTYHCSRCQRAYKRMVESDHKLCFYCLVGPPIARPRVVA